MIISKNRLNASLLACFVLLQATNTHGAARWADVIRETATHYGVEAVEPTSDGGYILAGQQQKGGHDEAWCAKLDALGNLTWQHTYGEAGDDAFQDVRPLSDGTYFVTGGTGSFGVGGYDIWCLLLGPSGNVIWQKTYGSGGSEVGLSGQPIAGGGFVVCGWTDSFGSGLKDVQCMRLDASGNVVWQKAYGGAGNDYGRSVQQTADGGFIIAGDARSFSSGNAQLWVLKLNQSGNVTWQKGYGLGTMASSSDIRVTSDGGYIMSGMIGGAMMDSWILKLASNGAVSWQTFIQQSAPEYPLINDVRQTSGGGYVALGDIRIGGTQTDAWFVGLGTNGGILWQKAAGGSGYDSATHVRSTVDGGFVAVGETLIGAHYCAFVSRHSAAGDIDAACNVQNAGVIATSPSTAVAATSGAAITTAVTVGNSITVAGTGLAIAEQECSSPAAPDLTGSWSNVGFKRSKLKGNFVCLNAGAAAAGGSTVKVYFSKTSTIGRKATLIKTQGLAGLAAFGTSSFKINATPGSKHKYVVAALDTGNAVAEDDEGNNIISWRFR